MKHTFQTQPTERWGTAGAALSPRSLQDKLKPNVPSVWVGAVVLLLKTSMLIGRLYSEHIACVSKQINTWNNILGV